MTDKPRFQSTAQRLVLMLVVFAIGGVCLYVVLDNLIFERRKHLLTLEIIFYIVAANILSFVILYLGTRAVRWVNHGPQASTDGERTQDE
jgi:hypothetical protein